LAEQNVMARGCADAFDAVRQEEGISVTMERDLDIDCYLLLPLLQMFWEVNSRDRPRMKLYFTIPLYASIANLGHKQHRAKF
jgi:hypothetical protein